MEKIAILCVESKGKPTGEPQGQKSREWKIAYGALFDAILANNGKIDTRAEYEAMKAGLTEEEAGKAIKEARQVFDKTNENIQVISRNPVKNIKDTKMKAIDNNALQPIEGIKAKEEGFMKKVNALDTGGSNKAGKAKRPKKTELSGGQEAAVIAKYTARILADENEEIECSKYIERMKAEGVKRPAKAIRAAIRERERLKTEPFAYLELLCEDIKEIDYKGFEWLKKWRIDKQTGKYMDIETGELIVRDAFNAANAKYMARDANGNAPTAANFARNYAKLGTISGIVYLPNTHKRIVKTETGYAMNIFRQDKLPKTASEYTEAGEKAIDLWLDHFRILCGSESDGLTLQYFLAQNVQKMGVKLDWMPIIHGIQGCGKTILGQMMAKIIGEGNAKPVTGRELKRDFNGWAENVAFLYFEEVSLKGKAGKEVYEDLKTFITQAAVKINRKSVQQYTAPNIANGMIYTNDPSPLPIEESDRRFFCVSCPIMDAGAAWLDATGQTHEAYFAALFSALENHAEELRKFFLELEIPESFCAQRTAPKTEYKNQMIEDAKPIWQEDIEEIIEEHKGEYVFTTKRLLQFWENAKGMEMKSPKEFRSKALQCLRSSSCHNFQKKVEVRGKSEKKKMKVWGINEAIDRLLPLETPNSKSIL